MEFYLQLLLGPGLLLIWLVLYSLPDPDAVRDDRPAERRAAAEQGSQRTWEEIAGQIVDVSQEEPEVYGEWIEYPYWKELPESIRIRLTRQPELIAELDDGFEKLEEEEMRLKIYEISGRLKREAAKEKGKASLPAWAVDQNKPDKTREISREKWEGYKWKRK